MCWINENKALILVLINFFVANLMFGQSVRTEQHIRLENPSDKSKYILLAAPTDLNIIQNFQFPSTGGTEGQVLTTNGIGGLTWEAPSTPALTDTTITSATTINGNHNLIYLTGATTYVVFLPSASSFKGKTFTIKAIANPTTNIIYNLKPQTGQKIDQQVILALKTYGVVGTFVLRGVTVISDGSNWQILSTVNY